jgi:hypothetical protein
MLYTIELLRDKADPIPFHRDFETDPTMKEVLEIAKNFALPSDDWNGKVDYYPTVKCKSVRGVQLFEMHELVDFGNYLLSKHREEILVNSGNANEVTLADITNWKERKIQHSEAP